MSKVKKIQLVCFNILKIALFCVFMAFWVYQFKTPLSDLSANTPFTFLFYPVFFLFLFFCRTMGCLVFMPKNTLKTIVYQRMLFLAFPQLLSRIFSKDVFKHLLSCLFLFASELLLRLLSISIFLKIITFSIPFLNFTTPLKVVSGNIMLAISAYLIMEFPFYLVFYKFSLKNHSNRLYEYHFGMKLSVFVLLLSVFYFLLTPLIDGFSPVSKEITRFCALTALGGCVWYLAYRKNTATDFVLSRIKRIKHKNTSCKKDNLPADEKSS